MIDPSGEVRREISEAIGDTTNNVAEYRGLIAALEAALALGAKRLEARLDSELIVRQAIGRYKVKNPGLIPLHNRVVGLRSRFDEVVFKHVPRAQNKRADALANRALDRPPAVTIAAIILAAGESTRMGRPKQLLPWGGTTLVAWQVQQMREAGADDVVVVLGHAADEVHAAVPSWADRRGQRGVQGRARVVAACGRRGAAGRDRVSANPERRPAAAGLGLAPPDRALA